MPAVDTASTTVALQSFQAAWLKSIDDYAQRKLNSEHTLQAALYHHLLSALPPGFRVYTEAVIRLSESTVEESERRKVVVDVLVCEEAEVILAAELKFVPRGVPTLDALRKDVRTLSCITNRRNLADRVAIEMPRFRSLDADSLRLKVPPYRKLILAVYFDGRPEHALSNDSFWTSVRPEAGSYWSDFGEQPKNLGVALAVTNDSGGASAHYFGGPFDRLAK
jgi:hypothetical protein